MLPQAKMPLSAVLRKSCQLYVNSAFGFGEPGPAAGAQIFAGTGLARVRPTAKAGVATIEQRVVGYLVGVDVAPHITLGPVCQRVNLQQVMARDPLHQLGGGSS